MGAIFFCVFDSSRPSEQSELKLVCSEFERSELSRDIDVKNWCPQETPGDRCKTDAGLGRSLPATKREAGMEPIELRMVVLGGIFVSLRKYPV